MPPLVARLPFQALENMSQVLPRLLLAPMEGLADDVLRDVLTGLGGYDGAVTEFVRVSDSLLPHRTFLRVSPELKRGGLARCGTPVAVQLLGSSPERLAENAARLAELQPPAIDLNFGCPAPTVNRHRGGAALLGEPELLHAIVRAVRAAVPADIPLTAKMRLGITGTERTLDCARALAEGGIAQLVVHGRTKVDGYRPPARWEWIAKVREAVPVPVVANGEVWTVEDWRRIRAETGCADVMIGRGAVADPWLARRIRIEGMGQADEWPQWADLLPALASFWPQVCAKVEARHAPGRLKQWLGMLARTYPEAAVLQQRVRPLRRLAEVEAALLEAGIICCRTQFVGNEGEG